MPANSNQPRRRSLPIRALSGLFALALTSALGVFAAGPLVAQAAEAEPAAPEDQSTQAASTLALPHTYLVTVTLQDFDQTFAFSTLTAQRHFSLSPAERDLQFRGRLWIQGDGRELLGFSIDFQQALPTPEHGRGHSRGSRWSGSTYFEPGRPIQVVESPDSKITVTLHKR